MATAIKKITAEEFLLLGLKNAELIDGEIEEYIPTKRKHGKITGEIVRRLGNWAKDNQAGEVGTEAGFLIATDPDRVRAPDIYFVAESRLPDIEVDGFWGIAPDLAVEVISDSDTVRVVFGKMRDYFALGTPLIWLVYPEEQIVEVCTPDGKRQTLQNEDRLENFTSLPGFSCAVGDLFR